MPETAQTKTKANDQNPSALCNPQLKRFQFPVQFATTLRRQLTMPGHQMTAPVVHKTVRKIAPAPVTLRRVPCYSSLSSKSTGLGAKRGRAGPGLPRSAAWHEFNGRCLRL